MTEDYAGQDYLTKGLALAAEGGDVRSGMRGDINQQFGLFSKAVELELPLPEKAIAHAFLMRCYAYQENLERALEELSVAREALGTLIGFQNKELDRFVQSTWDQSLAEERILGFVEDMAKHKPWYRLLFDTDDGLLDLYMFREGWGEDVTEQTRRTVELHYMQLFPDPDDLGFLLGYRYFELGKIEQAVLQFQKTIEEANTEKSRHNKYDARKPFHPEYGIPFRTILGLIYKEKGDLRRAIEEWQTALQIDEVWLEVCCQGFSFYDPIIHFWLDRAEELLKENEP